MYWVAPPLGVKAKASEYDSVLIKDRQGNHGHRAGVSLSKRGRDAIFWAERW